jgi:redox-sensitive bicupin YhaK (pirin superfamily)
MFYVDALLEQAAQLAIPPDYDEQAIYIVEGRLDLGNDGSFAAGQLLVLKPGKTVTVTAAGGPARLMLLGGEPMDGPRAVVWNFVSSSAERLEQAKEDWRQQRFPSIAGEREWIPFPDQPGKPVFYP